MKRRAGHLYLRGSTWWMKYYVAGRPVYESTGHEKETQAQRVLNERVGRIATGQTVLPRLDRVTYAEAVKDLREHYTSSGDRDVKEANFRLHHVDAFFAHYRLAAIGPADVTRYTAKRQAEGASNATINRELAVLGRMLKLAYENNKLARLPLIRKLKEAAARQGFFERHQYEAVRRHLPADLQTAIAVAYTFGWRMQSEVLSLERRHLDLDAGTLRLDPGMTKNGEGRVVYVTAELKALLAAQVERVRAIERKAGKIIPFLFPYLSGKRRLGERRRDFRKAWTTACLEAELGHLSGEARDKRRAWLRANPSGLMLALRHDFRRTAVRNMERTGVSRSVATKITGHKTEAVYRRYAIVSDSDLRAAAVLLADGYNHGDNRSVEVDARSLSR